jgi:hypothetical protein
MRRIADIGSRRYGSRVLRGNGAERDRLDPPQWAPRSASNLRLVVERSLHRLIAARRGPSDTDLGQDTSLTDGVVGLALDLAELAPAIETELGVALPHACLDGLRTYGELVEAVSAALAARHGPARPPRSPLVARLRIVASGAGTLEHAGALDPYTVQVLLDDARHVGPGALVEVELPGAAEASDVETIADRLAPLTARGVDIRIRRIPGPLPAA